jgi:hypothetical protein
VLDMTDPWLGWEFYSDADEVPYDMASLSKRLRGADLTVGFNSMSYDHTVVRSMVPDHAFQRELDLFCNVIKPAVGTMRGKGIWGLDGFCQRSFGVGKTSTQGAFAPTLAKTGRWGELVTYNAQDVGLTARLFIHMLTQRTVVGPDGSHIDVGDRLDDALERIAARDKVVAA